MYASPIKQMSKQQKSMLKKSIIIITMEVEFRDYISPVKLTNIVMLEMLVSLHGLKVHEKSIILLLVAQSSCGMLLSSKCGNVYTLTNGYNAEHPRTNVSIF